MNELALFINEKLGVKIYREDILYTLTLVKYSKKKIKELCIDDLITSEGKSSKRLIKLTKELLGEN